MSEPAHDELEHLAAIALGEVEADEIGRESGVSLRLAPFALTAWQMKAAITALIVLITIVGFTQLPFAPQFMKANLAVLCVLFLTPSILDIAVLNSLKHRHYVLHVFPERLVVSQGWTFRQVMTIPRASILNLKFRRDPILRRLGLTDVSIRTIADHHRIGPLDAGQTELIEEFVKGVRK